MFKTFLISDEVSKLQQRLSLLKEEYVKLQKHCEVVEKDRAKLRASSGALQNGDKDENSFIANILKAVASMLKSQDYSDMTVTLQNDEAIPGHKFVFNARSTNWNLKDASSLDWSHLPNDVSQAILEWIYCDQVTLIGKEDTFKLALMTAAKSFHLPQLMTMCERGLITSIRYLIFQPLGL